jgi:subtilisin family serine protease
MADRIAATDHRPDMKVFRISPAVRQDMTAAGGAAGIAVIISLQQSRTSPERGVTLSKEAVKAFLKSRAVESRDSDFYVFATLSPDIIRELATMRDFVDKIWRDETCRAQVLESTETVKATACWRAFGSVGKGITWAVLDTGIRSDHPHFLTNATIDQALSKNFSNSATLEDVDGHGTHVAGIIAGAAPPGSYQAATHEEDRDTPVIVDLSGPPSGVAPMTRLLNVKVLDDDGTGSASTCILALEYLRKLNASSREIQVDGCNLSLGYPYDPKWYGCGHSPLCEEVTRTVRSGIFVVVSCGNAGYGTATLSSGQQVPVSIDLSITDPANTEECIAVGSVHKSKPHLYGVSYFSSKGPTGDGRLKPDLVAPGEKIISCSVAFDKQPYAYEEKSGTSMAAPHVSGAIAMFLSAHQEFRGQPELVKQILTKSATDLKRAETFQGAGLIDLFRAVMSV